MYSCVRCEKISDTKYPEDQISEFGEYCDCCKNIFCSDKCAEIEHYEDTFPDCCPGVYWCFTCREEYLNWSKGHVFVPNLYPSKEEEGKLARYKKYLEGGIRCCFGKCIRCGLSDIEYVAPEEDNPHKGLSCNKVQVYLDIYKQWKMNRSGTEPVC